MESEESGEAVAVSHDQLVDVDAEEKVDEVSSGGEEEGESEVAESNEPANDEEVEEVEEESSFDESLCAVCGNEAPKYRCPGCHRQSCSLPCVRTHKEKYSCSGQRNKTQYIGLDKFTTEVLKSDFTFLEDIDRKLNSLQRLSKDLKVLEWKRNRRAVLHRTAINHGVHFRLLPPGLEKSKQNLSSVQKKKGNITWFVKWFFPQANNALFTDSMPEATSMADALKKYIDTGVAEPDLRCHLNMYCQAGGLAAVKLLMPAENHPANSHSVYSLDMAESLRKNLEGCVVYEHPVIHVVLATSPDVYNVVEREVHIRTPVNISVDDGSANTRHTVVVEDGTSQNLNQDTSAAMPMETAGHAQASPSNGLENHNGEAAAAAAAAVDSSRDSSGFMRGGSRGRGSNYRGRNHRGRGRGRGRGQHWRRDDRHAPYASHNTPSQYGGGGQNYYHGSEYGQQYGSYGYDPYTNHMAHLSRFPATPTDSRARSGSAPDSTRNAVAVSSSSSQAAADMKPAVSTGSSTVPVIKQEAASSASGALPSVKPEPSNDGYPAIKGEASQVTGDVKIKGKGAKDDQCEPDDSYFWYDHM